MHQGLANNRTSRNHQNMYVELTSTRIHAQSTAIGRHHDRSFDTDQSRIPDFLAFVLFAACLSERCCYWTFLVMHNDIGRTESTTFASLSTLFGRSKIRHLNKIETPHGNREWEGIVIAIFRFLICHSLWTIGRLSGSGQGTRRGYSARAHPESLVFYVADLLFWPHLWYCVPAGKGGQTTTLYI